MQSIPLEIQLAIEQGRIKFENPAKPMKIDGHPFPTNMVEVSDTSNKGKAKVLTFEWAEQSRAVDPKLQISADELPTQARAKLYETP
jgi:hypothetical protein